MVENLPDCKVSNPTLAEVAERGFSVLLEPVLNKKFRREHQAILVGEGQRIGSAEIQSRPYLLRSPSEGQEEVPKHPQPEEWVCPEDVDSVNLSA